MSISPNKLIDVVGLSFAYASAQALLFDNFSFRPASNLVVIEGYSGCGKSTLLRLLAGMLDPTRIVSLPDRQRSLLILQEDALFPWLTGTENLQCMLSSRELEGVSLGDEINGFTAMDGILDRPVYELSYGQRRIIELLRAFLWGPRIMYLDEPFNFLDGQNAERIWRRLVRLAGEGKHIVVATHEHRGLELCADAEVYRFLGNPPWRVLERRV